MILMNYIRGTFNIDCLKFDFFIIYDNYNVAMGLHIVEPALPQHYISDYVSLYEQLDMLPLSIVIVDGVRISISSHFGIAIITPDYEYRCNESELEIREIITMDTLVNWQTDTIDITSRRSYKNVAYKMFIECFTILQKIIESMNCLITVIPTNTILLDSYSLYKWVIDYDYAE